PSSWTRANSRSRRCSWAAYAPTGYGPGSLLSRMPSPAAVCGAVIRPPTLVHRPLPRNWRRSARGPGGGPVGRVVLQDLRIRAMPPPAAEELGEERPRGEHQDHAED